MFTLKMFLDIYNFLQQIEQTLPYWHVRTDFFCASPGNKGSGAPVHSVGWRRKYKIL